MRSLRVGIVALLQESNTFVQEPTTLERFEQDLLATGDEVRERLDGAHHEVGGFFEGLDAARIEAVPLFAARAYPSGVISAAAFDSLMAMTQAALQGAGALDGLLVAPHGATVSELFPDADGHWLATLRWRVGPEKPIVGTVDLHANLSPAMVQACDALVAYRTNPHVDQRSCGMTAAQIMARTLRGEIRPKMAAALPPMIINIQKGETSAPPCDQLLTTADAMLQRPGVLSNSVVHGFPYADVAEMGSSVLAVTDGDTLLAQEMVGELANTLWALRHEFEGELLGVADALDQAMSLDGPVCLLDMGDNVGGGSPGDATHLAAEIHSRRLPDTFVCLADAQAVQVAEAAGVGTRVALRIGGKADSLHAKPIEDEFTVVSLHDGQFEEPQARHGGYTTFDQGPTAIVRGRAGMTVMLTSRRMVPFSLRQLTSCGLDLARFRFVVAKGVNAPIAAYREVCRHFVRVNTPGATCADLTQLDYKRRRRPMFPFERGARWSADDVSTFVLGNSS